MKHIFKSGRFKLIVGIIVLLLVGMLISAVNGHSESAQSSVIGTVFAPVHWVADKTADTISRITKNAKGDAEYEKKIDELQKELGEAQNQLADYENLKTQNELYKQALDIKDDNDNIHFVNASVIARDSADPYCSFTISKGTANGISEGCAVLYGKYLVGVVKKAYPTYSVIETIINPSCSVSAYDINSKELSYATGDSALARQGYCKFENLDSNTNVTYGSIIATAGVGSIIPKGIVIGTIRDVRDEETNIATYGVIEPGTDIKSIDQCLVLVVDSAESEAE